MSKELPKSTPKPKPRENQEAGKPKSFESQTNTNAKAKPKAKLKPRKSHSKDKINEPKAKLSRKPSNLSLCVRRLGKCTVKRNYESKSS